MLRIFKPTDKIILTKGAAFAMATARTARKALESLETPTLALDTTTGRIELVREWLNDNAAGERALNGEIDVPHELALTMRTCARLYESKVARVEGEQESLDIEPGDTHSRRLDVTSLVARLSDQVELSIEEKREKEGRKGRPGGQD